MKLKNILIAVTDIEKSKEFYHSLFGLDVVLAREGNVPERDMFNTFNMGVGMTLVVAPEDAGKALEILKAHGEDAYRLGVIAQGDGVELV